MKLTRWVDDYMFKRLLSASEDYDQRENAAHYVQIEVTDTDLTNLLKEANK